MCDCCRFQEFVKQAQERLRYKVRNLYIHEHTRDTNLGAFIVEQTLNFLRYGPVGPSANGAELPQPLSQALKWNETGERSGLPLGKSYFPAHFI